jgi:hypothetical protein
LAKAEKYRYSFKSQEGQTCVVRFDFEGFTGSSTTLVASARPFVLKEFNTDDEIFKPLRPQMAEMSFIASASGVSIDNFLMDNDDDIIVYFDFGTWTNYWSGYMLQDDFQESWINTNHIITLRATEGIGQLKDVELTESGDELNGRYTPLELIQYAMAQTVQNFSDYKVFSNLFHSSMTDTSTNTGIDQCYVDAKTFQVNPSEYDDSYLALEKINKSWNQTLYMYKGKWVIFRQEELYVPYSENIRGYRQNGASRTDASQRFDALVGINQTIKPITPEMLRFIQRRTKSDTIQFNFDQFDEIICNGSFSRGDLVSSTSTLKTYELDQWNWYQGAINSTTIPTTGSFGRKESYAVGGKLDDQYAFLTQDSATTRFLKSCGTEVLQNEKIDVSVETKYKTTFAGVGNIDTLVIMLYGVTNNYTLDGDGRWYQSNASWTTNLKTIQIYYNGTPGILPQEYNTIQVTSEAIPEDGILYINLYNPNVPFVSSQERYFKSLQLTLSTTFNGIDVNTIQAVQSIFTKDDILKPKFFDEIYLDDGLSKLYKGSLYEDDQQTLTDADWHRYRYSSESNGFRKQNDIAHWSHNRINRNKIDANFYGLTWSSGTEPIGLINTVRFTDDDPNRIYTIANLKEIDFSSSTWSATLVEVFDMDNDATGSPVARTLSLDANVGRVITFVKWDIISLADFTADSGLSKFTFAGSTSITTTITCNLQGYTITTTSTPITVDIYLKRNSTILNTQTFTVTSNPTSFNVTLTTSSVAIAPGDQIYVEMDSDITETQITGGILQATYNVTSAVSYDPYEDKYIYK